MHKSSASDESVVDIVYESFAQSRDFNGMPMSKLISALDSNVESVQERIEHLLRTGKVTLTFASHSENPYIKRIKDLPTESQISRMRSEPLDEICVYPSPAIAKDRVTGSFDDKPYAKRLALAEPQLTPVFFELPVLERYFRDPRYHCWFGDSEGTISIGDSVYFSEHTTERDKISLQSFGIGYDVDRKRVVVVFLRYLAGLSPEHQVYWSTHEVPGACTMNSDYERASIWGAWPDHFSAYAALIQEQVEINRLSKLIGKPALFKETFEDHKRPIEFSSMLRPTLKYFNDFVHLLDKMLSDNMDRQFFDGDISLEERITRRDGTIEVRPLGTLTLLEHWLKRRYRDRDSKEVSKEVVAPFKEIRKARQPAAHKIGQNEYDPSLPSRQDELVGKIKNGLTILRLILSSHPLARDYKPPDWLDGGKIVFY